MKKSTVIIILVVVLLLAIVGGGLYAGLMAPTPQMAWDGIMELYYYSREFYEGKL